MTSFRTNDPANCRQLSSADSELIAHNGPSKIPSSFLYESDMILKEATLTVRHFPEID